MTLSNISFLIIYFLILFLLIKPVGTYIVKVYDGSALSRFSKIEQVIFRITRISPKQEMNWKSYLIAMFVFNFFGIIFLYILQRLQWFLPLNPVMVSGPSSDLAFNTAISFVTNSDWQALNQVDTFSYFTKMVGFTAQNFISAATGLSLLVAFIRGLVQEENPNLGNFWVDVVRGTLYILLPLSIILAIILSSQGVIQNLSPSQTINVYQTLEPQTLPMGPVASEVAIKQLGTNGGGFFNANSAHPFENPTGFTNFLELLAILLIPVALCYSFGLMVNDKRQGLSILFLMFLIFIPLAYCTIHAEYMGNPYFKQMGLLSTENMEGKELRFGITGSGLWAAATTASSNGSVNAMLDSFTPIGSFIPLWMMQTGEVIFGGIGTGLYGMLMLIIITVFVGGLMVGRSPEFLGKKIGIYEMKMAMVAVIIFPLTTLILTAITIVFFGVNTEGNPGPHGFTELLYTFTSLTSNNGSAFSGLNTNNYFYNVIGGIAMMIGRFWVAIPVIAIAGSMAIKKRVPANLATLPTHNLLFIFLLTGMILSALTFFPALALGPIVESLILWGK